MTDNTTTKEGIREFFAFLRQYAQVLLHGHPEHQAWRFDGWSLDGRIRLERPRANVWYCTPEELVEFGPIEKVEDEGASEPPIVRGMPGH